MLLNRDAFVKAYHDRMYYFSSGTKFTLVGGPLMDWMTRQDKLREAYIKEHDDLSNAPPSSVRALKRLMDVNGLYEILGDACINFMKEKPQPYGMAALNSKESFWDVPGFKRKLFFVFFIRFVLGFKSQRNWKKFRESDYKFNTRCFKRWGEREYDIMSQSPLFNKMRDRNVRLSVTPKKRK